MEKENILRQLPQLLLPWFFAHKRDLPWRKDREPYHIWVSEIMLQQTRVEAVKGYYQRFLSQLPTIESLAHAEDEQLHKLWEGLGYYSRVRNLKKAAVMICDEFGGVFPEAYDSIIRLPGIGAYTAGAISSIAFDQPTPAVDGNVLRVYTRLMADPSVIDDPAFKKLVCNQLAEIYPEEAGDFTQALMELGATVCVPNGKPSCDRCPCNKLCKAYEKGTQQQFPVKASKKQRKLDEKTVLIMRCDGAYALIKRPAKGLLAGLWQFPDLPGKLSAEQVLERLESQGVIVRDVLRTVEKNHIFTHVEWDMRGVYLELTERSGEYTWMTPEMVRNEAAIPTAFRQFWEILPEN